ncbi:MAG: sigma-70 family RNA polymerase sigma factor [Acidobacteria bacterium]|nr:sigma-70 family RNA polymerase sigma factor [Acidobacteriota bacterium]MCI0628047.1 sigma-70 family RNA polymerase sigma factor [Acidobacteriota bacterium]MCI0718049.1 sigma-70 family RNA polymerase sigma factor [Acidobacteriota bacterium]
MGNKYRAGEELGLDRALLVALRDSSSLKHTEAVVFELLRDPVYRYFVCVLGDTAEAEDLTQEAFLRLYRHWRQGQKVDDARAWVFRVAHNLAIDHQRKRNLVEPLDEEAWQKVCERNADPSPNAEQQILQREQEGKVQAVLRQLSPQERECLNLRAEGLTYREIANVLGMRPPTLVSFLGRIIHRVIRDLYD